MITEKPPVIVHTSFVLLFVLGGLPIACSTPAPGRLAGGKDIIQAHGVFTVAESKRLIAKGVVRMPIVQKALRDGMVIVCKGTTNTYVAEELLGRKIAHGSMVLGHVLPQEGDKRLPKTETIREVVLIKGEYRPDLPLKEALELLEPGDVVLKGGNALDYANKTAAVWTASPTGGTTGKIEPYVTEGRAHLIVPIGLEKQVAGKVHDIANMVNEPVESRNRLPHMRILPGQIVPEIEALRILTNVDAFQASAGGIGGAEGAVWLIWRGEQANVEKAREITRSVQGEPPFVE